MALAFAIKHYLQLLCGLQEFGYDITHSLSMYNTGADDLAHNPRIGDKSKHIQVAFYFTHGLVENGTIVVLHTTLKENLADICTKTIVGTDSLVLRYLIMNLFYLVAVLFQLYIYITYLLIGLQMKRGVENARHAYTLCIIRDNLYHSPMGE